MNAASSSSEAAFEEKSMAREGDRLPRSTPSWLRAARTKPGGEALRDQKGSEHFAQIGQRGGQSSGASRRAKAGLADGTVRVQIRVYPELQELVVHAAAVMDCTTSEIYMD